MSQTIDRFEVEVYNALRELNIPANVRGYKYIQSALSFLRKNPDAIYSITQKLYPGVAAMYGPDVKWNRIERGIRHAISLSRADDATWYKVLGNVGRPKVGKTGRMANGEFLSTLLEAIKIKLAIEGAKS